MANAADYLLLDTTQLVNTYKLRTRSIESRRFVAKNIAPNYILSAVLSSNLDGITLSPSAFILQPDESITVTVEYRTDALEVYPPGTIEGSFDIAVAATPVVIPQIPISPPAPELPDAPQQVISRIQILPTNFTLSEVGEVNKFDAILYVDDIPTPATFQWSLENDSNNSFSIDVNNGVVKALRNGVAKATVKAKLLTPTQYIGTEGLSIVAVNIPVVVPVGGEPVPTTGNLTVIINGMRSTIGADVSISGINQSITGTTTFNNIPAGNYTVTPNVVTSGGVNYNPTGGGQVNVTPGQNVEIVITYAKQILPSVNSIQITNVVDSSGNNIQPGQSVKTGERIVVVANTYRNGVITNIGDVQFTMNNTQEGVQLLQGRTDGIYKATFTVTQPGQLNVTAFNQSAGSVTGQINATQATSYTIKITSPSTLIVGQSSPLTAVVLQDGVETDIPVEVEIGNGIGTITGKKPKTERPTAPPVATPPEPPQFIPAVTPEPTATGTSNASGATVGIDFTSPILDRATTTSRTSNEAELRTGGNTVRDVAFVDQGENAI